MYIMLKVYFIKWRNSWTVWKMGF